MNSDGGQRRPSDLKLHALIGLMTLVWACNFIVVKKIGAHLPSFFLATLRTVVAGACIAPIYFHKPRVPFRPGDLKALLIMGIAGIALNQIAFVLGLARTSVAHAAIVNALTPVQVLLVAAWRGQEHITARKAIGLATAAAGVLWLQLGKASTAGATLFGDFLMWSGTFLFAVFSVYARDYTKRLGSIGVTGFGFISSAIACLPFALWSGAQLDLSAVPLWAWIGVVYMAAFSSVMGYLIFNYAVSWLPASRVAAFLYSTPILASLMGWLVLGEALTIAVGVSAALVLGGVMLVERSR